MPRAARFSLLDGAGSRVIAPLSPGYRLISGQGRDPPSPAKILDDKRRNQSRAERDVHRRDVRHPQMKLEARREALRRDHVVAEGGDGRQRARERDASTVFWARVAA